MHRIVASDGSAGSGTQQYLTRPDSGPGGDALANARLGLGPAQPNRRVAVTVNHADHADHFRIELEIDRIGKPLEQHPPQLAADGAMLLWASFDRLDSRVDRFKKALGCRWRLGSVPLESVGNLRLRDSADDDSSHLP